MHRWQATPTVRFVPYRKFVLRSPLSPATAMQALAKEVEPRRWLRLSLGSSLFLGTVGDTSFDIERAIQYRNSFLPQIQGAVCAEAAGCSISITLKLHPFVLAFSAVWLSLVGTIGLAFGLSALAERHFDKAGLIPVGMFLFFVLMATASFGFEARKAEKLLLEIFAATRQDDTAGAPR